MSYFLPSLFAVLSLAGICWIIAGKISALASLPEEEAGLPRLPAYFSGGFFISLARNFSRLVSRSAFVSFLSLLEKNLRKIKIAALKIDNKISAWIRHLRDLITHHQQAAGKSGEFKLDLEEMKAKKIPDAKIVDGVQGNLKEEYLIEILAREPANVAAYKELGRIYLAKNRPAEAREVFAFALKLNPEDEEIKRYLSRLA